MAIRMPASYAIVQRLDDGQLVVFHESIHLTNNPAWSNP